jgi:NADPH:quinone reductase-like Zn-dependent oxidoreductase
MMRAYQLEVFGDPAGIVERDREVPEVGPNDVLVRVRATAINERDLFILKGTYPLPARPGVIPLSDGAGEVVAVGQDVTRFRVGDRVAGNYFVRWRSGAISPDLFDQLGCTLDGMLTEFAILNEEWAVRIPDHLSWEEAATLPCAGVTAWNAVVGPVPVVAGQTVLTLGSGGVSLFALQFAKTLGAQLIATTSIPEKVKRLKEVGADIVIDASENPEWGKVVRDATGGHGADLVVETMGADTIEQSMRAVSIHGQIMLLIAARHEQAGHPDFRGGLRDNHGHHPPRLRGQPHEFRGDEPGHHPGVAEADHRPRVRLVQLPRGLQLFLARQVVRQGRRVRHSRQLGEIS